MVTGRYGSSGSSRKLLDFFLLRLVSRNPERAQEAAIVGADFELTALWRYGHDSRLLLRGRGHGRACQRPSLRAAHEPDHRLQGYPHLEPGGARFFTARFH